MQLYIFASTSIENIRRGIEHNRWAVAPMDSPQEGSRRGRSANMAVGSAGLFYCSDSRNKVFTTPFIVESVPEDRAISDIWEDTWYLPFSIRPIGELDRKVTWLHARNSWPFLRDAENPGGLVAPIRVFAPIPLRRHEWDNMLTSLGVDPEKFEDLW